MIPIYRAALDLQKICYEQAWRFCFIGGLVVPRWGEARYTHDADMTLFADLGREEAFIDLLLKHFAPRRPDAAAFAVRARVLLLRHPNGVPVDVALGALSFEANAIARSSIWRVEADCELRTCSAEDLIVHKSFAGRAGDWIDVEGILRRQGKKLDVRQIVEELEPLATVKELPEMLIQLRQLFRKYSLAAD